MKKKEFLTETKRKIIIADKEKAIIESFAKTFNKIKRIDENEIGNDETIYVDNDLSDYFDIPYQNDGEQTVINTGALRNNSRRSWDSKHLAIFDKYAGKDLLLIGKGFGWWEIKNPSKLNSPQQNVGGNGLEEYDNYNYPAGADADSNAPWNQDDDREPEYEYRKGNLDDYYFDSNYNGPFEEQTIKFESTEAGVCEVTMGEIFKTLDIPNQVIEKLKASNTTSQENKIAQQIYKETGTYPEEFSRKVSIYNEISEPIFIKYGNEFAEYTYEIEQDEYEGPDGDDRDYYGDDW